MPSQSLHLDVKDWSTRVLTAKVETRLAGPSKTRLHSTPRVRHSGTAWRIIPISLLVSTTTEAGPLKTSSVSSSAILTLGDCCLLSITGVAVAALLAEES